MVALIVISGIVCFLILTPSQRQKEKMPDFFKGTTNVSNEVTDGVGQIIDLGTKISDLNTLRKQVEAVLAKPKLSHADTVFLEKAIQQLEQSNKPRNQQKP
jgi:preprotein translocase subunit YajC